MAGTACQRDLGGRLLHFGGHAKNRDGPAGCTACRCSSSCRCANRVAAAGDERVTHDERRGFDEIRKLRGPPYRMTIGTYGGVRTSRVLKKGGEICAL